jgi:RNA polymerase sigma-70 factor (ECF subfamily)
MVAQAMPLLRTSGPAAPWSVSEPVRSHAGPDRETLSDNALVAAIAAGDIAALDQLYRRYRSLAFAAAFTLAREPAIAEDAVHDAFLSVWRAATSFQPTRGSLRAWLLTIVRNAVTDHLRTRRLAPPPDATNHPVPETPASEDVFATVAANAEARRLHRALQSLPPSQRHALELSFFGGLSHGEIAARTGVPLGTVKGRVRLGLRRLRHDLRDLAPHSRVPAMHAA